MVGTRYDCVWDSLGVAYGSITGNMAFIGIGLPIGMALGIAVGTGMDKKQ